MYHRVKVPMDPPHQSEFASELEFLRRKQTIKRGQYGNPSQKSMLVKARLMAMEYMMSFVNVGARPAMSSRRKERARERERETQRARQRKNDRAAQAFQRSKINRVKTILRLSHRAIDFPPRGKLIRWRLRMCVALARLGDCVQVRKKGAHVLPSCSTAHGPAHLRGMRGSIQARLQHCCRDFPKVTWVMWMKSASDTSACTHAHTHTRVKCVCIAVVHRAANQSEVGHI